MNSDVSEKVMEFLHQELDWIKVDLHPETRIKHDLHVNGTDAVELLDKFAEIFGVDMSPCQFNRYFGPEGADPFLLLWYLVTRKKWVPVTIGDLIRCAEVGRWICALEDENP